MYSKIACIENILKTFWQIKDFTIKQNYKNFIAPSFQISIRIFHPFYLFQNISKTLVPSNIKPRIKFKCNSLPYLLYISTLEVYDKHAFFHAQFTSLASLSYKLLTNSVKHNKPKKSFAFRRSFIKVRLSSSNALWNKFMVL